MKNTKKAKTVKNENCCKNNKQSIAQKILQWLKRNFTATIIGLVLSIIGIALTIFFGINDSSNRKTTKTNTSVTTTAIDANLDKNILLDISLMNYQDVIKQMSEEETWEFEWSYPEFQYKDAIINSNYSIIPQNKYYNDYYDKHAVNVPSLAYWEDCSLQTHACYLDVKIVNNSDATLILDKLLIDVEESKIDETPFLYMCTEEAYTSHIFFVNEGYGKWDGFDFEFALLKPDQTFNGEYVFKTYIPYFEDAYRMDLRSYIKSVGFDYDRLLKETPAEYNIEDGNNFIYLYIQQDSIRKYEKYAEPFQFIPSNDRFIDEYTNYNIHAKLIGKITFHGYPISINIQADVPITTEAGFGGGFNFSSKYDIKLREQSSNYQIKHPISLSLKPNEAERIALVFTAKKTSNHKLKIALDNINGLDIKCNPISLSIFQPRTFQEILDNETR